MQTQYTSDKNQLKRKNKTFFPYYIQADALNGVIKASLASQLPSVNGGDKGTGTPVDEFEDLGN